MGNSRSINIFSTKTIYLLFGFFIIYASGIYGQNYKLGDSLEAVYLSGKYDEQNKLSLLSELIENHTDPDKQLFFSEELIKTAEVADSTGFLINGYLQKGYALRIKGNYSAALKSYFKAAEIALEKKSIQDQGKAYITIADVYSDMGNHKNAINYYQSAIDIFRVKNDSLYLGIALFNTGDEYLNIKKNDSALIYFNESNIYFKKIDYAIGMAYNLGNMGRVYAEQGKSALAKEYINQAIKTLEEVKDYTPISEFLTYMSDIYANQNNLKVALSYAHQSLDLANKYGLKKQISESNLKLSELYEENGNFSKSLKYYKNYVIYRDSVNNIASIQNIADLRTDFEVQKKQDEIVLLEKKAEISQLQSKREKYTTYASIVVSVLIFLLALGIYRRYKYINKTSHIIQLETDKSEKLLLNILPEGTANELKRSGKVQAKQFNSVSVMFTDFKNFTKHSQNLTPEELVKSVDYYFSKFDTIIEKYKLEKIKTIGDAYMCAGGLPYPTKDHAKNIILAGIEIAEFIDYSQQNHPKNIKSFNIRIGINSGPVIAGVVGLKKFSYDIWGDTVNVASRMESSSDSGKINVSETTYQFIKNDFDCTYRGEIEVKNRGVMKMYFVNGVNKLMKESG